MEVTGKKILIIGLGKTGVSLARFLVKRGAHVLVTDIRDAKDMKENINALKGLPVNFHMGRHCGDGLSEVDMIIPSPGVPPYNEFLVEGAEKGLPIISEIELAFSYLKEPVVAITGTNGKTTTTKLIGEMLKRCGKRVFVGGNIGEPLIEYVDGEERADYLVVEVSSFQLQWVGNFHPYVAILLNMSADHLDYHENFEEYRSIKERVFARQTSDDLAILNADDPLSEEMAGKIDADIIQFSSSKKLKRGISIDGPLLRYRDEGGVKEDYPVEGFQIRGVHNLENIMAAIVAARRCGCPSAGIIEAVRNFEGIPHRIEFVRSKNGVDIYNDSKGTNVDAVKRALESFSRPVILLMGGRYKGGDFGILSTLIREKVKKVILFGEARDKIESFIEGITDTGWSENLKDALEKAYDSASPGDVILLSPGCSSFDSFANYKERGNYFKEIARDL
ncbi:MAG: UDP-N-acetylmuramoyl-L-alanine--D-glutamate ligase [Deltaproteobacteria bacterium]|nr:UDP-N-acetylmuramoyl-L-alanine--D-glutamate ligase [Deltaproteobacteria bacterium]